MNTVCGRCIRIFSFKSLFLCFIQFSFCCPYTVSLSLIYLLPSSIDSKQAGKLSAAPGRALQQQGPVRTLAWCCCSAGELQFTLSSLDNHPETHRQPELLTLFPLCLTLALALKKLLHQCSLTRVYACFQKIRKKKKPERRAMCKGKNILHPFIFLRKCDIKRTHQLMHFKHTSTANTDKSYVNVSLADQEDLLISECLSTTKTILFTTPDVMVNRRPQGYVPAIAILP